MSSVDSIDLSDDETIEKVYQKKTQLEHILLRPDSYVGSIKTEEKTLWVYDTEKGHMIEKKITYNPGLYKIYDEILVNASDNKIRDRKMTCIKIEINGPKNMIRIWNNGKGIPVVMHKDVNVYVPTMIFGQLLTSTNFNDEKKQVTGGRNGYGAKLCNIFSTEFILETSNKEYGKSFKQTWNGNMSSCSDPVIGACNKEDFTCVTFYPDLKRFGMKHLDDDTISLFSRRAYDIAACTNGISVYLNGQQIPVKTFKDYVELYTKGCVDSSEEELKVIYEKFGDRWEVAITTSLNDSFSQVSFVNSIATTKGGTHVNYVTDQAASKLLEIAKKKIKSDKQAVKLKVAQVKMNLWVFVKCLIENPSFDSQTKENMTLNAKDFGSTCVLSEKFINQVSKCGIVEKITMWAMFKNQALLDKKCSKTKQSKLKDIPKLDDANFAGTKHSLQCTLILTEGDSAKTLAVSGLAVIGRDYYGVFPLRGKLLNVREASSKQLSENAEITHLIKIMGLQYAQKYETPESLKTLRYGKLMIMTDQDQDGSHIKGLLINFIHSKWPNLLKHNFLEQFITPIVKAFKNNQELSFYSIPELLEWQRNNADSNKWRLKYYKGLGTSTSKEAKEYFNDMVRHLIKFRYEGEQDGKSIVLAFSKNKADERKEWLTSWMEECKRRREIGLDDIYLYGKGTKHITYDNFINQELILFSNTDNERSIPNMMDGFKPGQRKVLFACLKRNLVKELKVAQLAGSVAELSAYHHGEASLMATIINLAQDYVGSNNINLLMPNGQFGTRLAGGKDSASPRYICTQLNKITKLIFHSHDEPILKNLYDDNQRIEPEWYAPIIPMVLINGCDGIGTGWSSKIPNFNPKDVINNIKRLINGETPVKMHPWYRYFRGTITELYENKYQVSGEVSLLGENSLEITELPVRIWTSTYKENVMEVFRHGNDKTPAVITDYKEYNTDKTVRFVVEMNDGKYAEAESMGFHKFFKLQSQLTLSNMILFDECGVIKKYNNVLDILTNFYKVRLEMYGKRKNYLLGILSAEASKLQNQARFILEKIEGKVVCENVKIDVLIEKLKKANYDSDPVKAWQKTVGNLLTIEKGEDENEEADESTDKKGDSEKPDYSYLTSLQIVTLTEEKKNELLAERDAKLSELEKVQNKTLEQLWLDDLAVLEKELDAAKVLEMSENLENTNSVTKKTSKKGGRSVKVASETAPSKFGVRVEPKIEEEYLKKAVIDNEKKKKQSNVKKQKQMTDDFSSSKENGDIMSGSLENNDYEEPTLIERISNNFKDIAKDIPKNIGKKNKKPSIQKEGNKKSPSKKRKREAWESDDDLSPSKKRKKGLLDTDSEKESDISDSFIPDPIPRDTNVKRNAAKNVKYNFHDDEDDEAADFIESHSSPAEDDDEYVPIEDKVTNKAESGPVTSSKKTEDPKPVKRKNVVSKDESQPAKKLKLSKTKEKSSNVNKANNKEKSEKKNKKEPKPKVSKKNRASDDDDDDDNDDDDEDDIDNIFRPDSQNDDNEKPANRARRQIQRKVYADSDSEEADVEKNSSGSEFNLQSELK